MDGRKATFILMGVIHPALLSITIDRENKRTRLGKAKKQAMETAVFAFSSGERQTARLGFCDSWTEEVKRKDAFLFCDGTERQGAS